MPRLISCPHHAAHLRGALGRLRLCLERRSVQLPALALLAILPLPSVPVRFPPYLSLFLSLLASRVQTHLPFGKSQFALTPPLGNDALLLLERAAHDTRCDGDVAVVATSSR